MLWRMREYLPYPPEDARLSYQVMAKQPASVEILGVAVRNSVLAEYETAMAGINGGPALVLPARWRCCRCFPTKRADNFCCTSAPER